MVTVLRYCHRRKRQLINEGETNQRLPSSATLISGSRPNWLSGLLANRDKMHMIDHVKAHLMIGIELRNHIYISLLVESIQTLGEELIAIVIWLGSHSIPLLMESLKIKRASVIVCPYLAMHVSLAVTLKMASLMQLLTMHLNFQ